MGIFDKGVKKTNLNFFQKLGRAITGKSKVDEDVLDALEEALLSSDMGVDTTLKLIENIEDRVEKDKYVDMEELVALIDGYRSDKAGKRVIRVGVNGAMNGQWNAVQKILDERGDNIYIELVEFDAYNLPNEALNSGEIDLNAFQHKAYIAIVYSNTVYPSRFFLF